LDSCAGNVEHQRRERTETRATRASEQRQPFTRPGQYLGGLCCRSVRAALSPESLSPSSETSPRVEHTHVSAAPSLSLGAFFPHKLSESFPIVSDGRSTHTCWACGRRGTSSALFFSLYLPLGRSRCSPVSLSERFRLKSHSFKWRGSPGLRPAWEDPPVKG
jgi:hypothetical protein